MCFHGMLQVYGLIAYALLIAYLWWSSLRAK